MNIKDISNYLQGEMNGKNDEIIHSLLMEIQSMCEGRSERFTYMAMYAAELFCRGLTREDVIEYARKNI